MTTLQDYFPFNLLNLGGLSGLQTPQGILGATPFPLFSTWPFSGQQQTQSGLIATLPWAVDATAYNSGLVPSGFPLLPPMSDIPDAVIDTVDAVLTAPETAANSITSSVNTLASSLVGQQQQQATNVAVNTYSALRNMFKTMITAPETVRQSYTGQQQIATQQQSVQQSQQQQVFQ